MTRFFSRYVFPATLVAVAYWALSGPTLATAAEPDFDQPTCELECGKSLPCNDALPVLDALHLQRVSFKTPRLHRMAGAFRTRGHLAGEELGATAGFAQVLSRRGPYAPRPLHLAICVWRT